MDVLTNGIPFILIANNMLIKIALPDGNALLTPKKIDSSCRIRFKLVNDDGQRMAFIRHYTGHTLPQYNHAMYMVWHDYKRI